MYQQIIMYMICFHENNTLVDEIAMSICFINFDLRVHILRLTIYFQALWNRKDF